MELDLWEGQFNLSSLQGLEGLTEEQKERLPNGNGGKNSRRRANTLDSTMSRTIDKRARGTNVKAVGNRRRGESGNAACRISSNG